MPVFIVPVSFEVAIVAKDAKEAAKLVKREYAVMEFEENHIFDVGTPVRLNNANEVPAEMKHTLPWNGCGDRDIECHIEHCCCHNHT